MTAPTELKQLADCVVDCVLTLGSQNLLPCIYGRQDQETVEGRELLLAIGLLVGFGRVALGVVLFPRLPGRGPFLFNRGLEVGEPATQGPG